MSNNIYVYIFVMASVTYLIRMLPLTLIKRQITNNFIKSFLFYVPFATLAAMTFPVILYSTSSLISAWVGFLTALYLAYREHSMIKVAVLACAAVFAAEYFL